MKKANFVMCPSCFWCATYFLADANFPNCPSCGGVAVDSIPISENEFYDLGVGENGNEKQRLAANTSSAL